MPSPLRGSRLRTSSHVTKVTQELADSNDVGFVFLVLKDQMAEPTGLEPATSHVTGERSNQLNYDSVRRRCLST